MLKIYNSYVDKGIIKIEDYITFRYGLYDTGINGFGEIKSGNPNCIKANYERQTLESFLEYVKDVKSEDGLALDYTIFDPMSYGTLEERFRGIPKEEKSYSEYLLNEEGVLLLTNYIDLDYEDDDLVQKIFGRYRGSAMYLLKPNARISMSIVSKNTDSSETYEVLQSNNLGKQLFLTKINRRV